MGFKAFYLDIPMYKIKAKYTFHLIDDIFLLLPYLIGKSQGMTQGVHSKTNYLRPNRRSHACL
jgi:hypothetical protein